MQYSFSFPIVVFLFFTPISFEFLFGSDGVQQGIKILAWFFAFCAGCSIVVRKQFSLRLNVVFFPYLTILVWVTTAVVNGIPYGVFVGIIVIFYMFYIDQAVYLKGKELDRAWVYNSLLLAFAALTIVNFAISFFGLGYMKSEGYSRLFGVVGHPSQASQIAAVTIILTLYHRCHFFLKIALIAICFFVMLEAGGRTIFLSLMLAVLVCLFFNRRLSKLIIFGLVVFGIMAPYFFVYLQGLLFEISDEVNFLARSGELRELYTLSGRIPLWRSIFDSNLSSWFSGVGFGGAGIFLPELYQTPWGWSTSSAHNAYLHILYESGLVGLVAFVWFFLKNVIAVQEKVGIAIVIFISGVSVMSSTYAGPGVSPLLLVMLLVFRVSGRDFVYSGNGVA